MKYTTTPWFRDIALPTYSQLVGDISADATIIGGGIAGLITAYFLQEEGLSVVVAEKGKLFSGATGLTTAEVTEHIDTAARDLVAMLGAEDAKLVLLSHKQAIDTIEKIINEEGIDCDFERCSDYIYTRSPEELPKLQEEHEVLMTLGVDCRLSQGNGLATAIANELGFDTSGYIEIPNQGKFHPLKFAIGLAKILETRGARIFEQSEITDVLVSGDKRISKAKTGSALSTWVVSATYEPFAEPLNLFFKKGMYHSFVLELEIAKDTLKPAIYEDTSNPYHYFRIDTGMYHDRMIIGGEDSKSIIPVNTEKHFNALARYVEDTFVGLKYEVVYRWGGPILESVDGLAFIGPSGDQQVLYIMAFSGNGMTYSAIAGVMIADLVSGRENPFYHIYKTSRWLHLTSLAIKFRDFTEEMIGGVVKDAFGSNVPKKK